MGNRKKLALAFPPFSTPTSAPLGVCMLKGYVERSLSDWSVRAIDLNLLTYRKIFGFMANGRYLDPRAFREGPLGEIALSRAAEVFSGGNDHEFYHRPDRYTIYADLMLRLAEYEVGNFRYLEAAYKQDGAMPPLVEEYAKVILDEAPDVVGLSLCYSHQVWIALCIAKAVRRRSSAPILWGGTFFGPHKEQFALEHQGVVDAIVAGEGELALVELLQTLDNPRQVPGVTYVENGEAHSNPPVFEHDLDSLGHPDFSDLDLNAYYCPSPVVPILTSRGCYWRKCAFCVHYQSAGQTYRRHSISYLLEELSRHVEAGTTHFSLVDEMISPKRFRELAQGILDAGLSIRYYALAKPVKQFDSELLSMMHESGCRYLLLSLIHI